MSRSPVGVPPPDAEQSVPRRLAVLVPLAVLELLGGWEWNHTQWPPAAADVTVPVIIVITYVTLWWRWRRPVLVLVVVLALGLTSLLMPTYHPAFAALTGLYAVAARRSRRVSLPALAAVDGQLALVQLTYAPQDNLLGSRMVSAGLWWIIAGLVWLVAYRFSGQARALVELEQRRAAAVSAALAAERIRLARELHDIVSHAVSVMVLQAAGGRKVLATNPQRAEQAMVAIEDLGHEAMDELRRLLSVLRSAAGEDAPDDVDAPGLEELEPLLRRTREAGIYATLTVQGEPGVLAPSVDLSAYRVIQEALTNTVRHAGARATARVLLRWQTTGPQPPTLGIEIEDEPYAGPDATAAAAGDVPGGGLGLLGLRERVAAIGGQFEARPHGRGFLVTALLPAAPTPAVIALPGEQLTGDVP